MYIIIVAVADGCGTWDADHDAIYGYYDFAAAITVAHKLGGRVLEPGQRRR